MTQYRGDSPLDVMVQLLRLIAKELIVSNRHLSRISAKESMIMSIQDDLATAVKTLSDNIDAHDVAIQAEIVALKVAVDAGNSAAISVAIGNIAAASSKIAGETKLLNDSLAPPAPIPAPEPTPEPAPVPPAPPSDAPPTV